MPSKNPNASLDRLFSALADRTRLRLLNMIASKEICVCYFVWVTGAPQPKISRHLAYLRGAGLVAARREGKWMYYRLAAPSDARTAAILKTTLEALQHDKDLQRDLQRLTKACCGPTEFGPRNKGMSGKRGGRVAQVVLN